jgi:hypothetical protein
MRWNDFFHHLEYDLALEVRPQPDGPLTRHHVDSHILDVCARAKASGHQVTVGVVTGEVFHVAPRAISTEWFSGLVGGDQGSGVVIPLLSVGWLESDSMTPDGEKSAVVGATLSDVLNDMVSRHAQVTIHTQHGDIAGVITSVGHEFCDVAGTSATTARRVPFSSIVAVFQGSGTWG